MKPRLLLLLACLGCCTRLYGASAETSKVPTGQMDLKIEALLRGLADESFRVREESTRALWELGEAALPALRGASTSEDPEQAIRARDLLRKIQLHITPDTDPSVIQLIESYHKASPTEKSSLLGKLRGKRAWRPMLKLYAAETNAELREQVAPIMSAVASKAARERLVQGDPAGAREFLEMAPADMSGLLALADFHRSQGTLEAELEQADAAIWRLALYRAAGNPTAARDAATAAGQAPIAAVMAALAGDPLPFLREMRDNDPGSLASNYATIASKRWQGEKIRKEDLLPITRIITARDRSTEHAGAIGALFLLGEVETAEPAFAKAQPLAAFSHFEALERVPEALRAIGLNPEKPDYKAWVEQRLNRLMKADPGEQTEVSDDSEQLLTLANFLERRGLHEMAMHTFGPPMATMAKDEPEGFQELLGRLFGSGDTLSGAPRLAGEIGASWAGDDANRWEDLRIAAFGDDEESREWWTWLAEIEPDASPASRFDALLALRGIGPDPKGLRDKWLKRLWQAVEKADPAQRQTLLGNIAGLASEIGDATISLKSWDQLLPAGRNKIFWGLQIVHLTAAERWNDAADVLLKQIAAITEAKQEPTADLHAYAAATLRAAGRNEEAARHDRWADQLVLGNAVVALRTGNGYAFGRDYRRAAAWWKRAAMQATPASEEFAQAMQSHATALLEMENWTETAAVSEIIAATYAGNEFQWVNQLPLMRQRLQADTARALMRLPTDRAGATSMLARCHRLFISDGSLADFFFPALRKAGLLKEHDTWFVESWNKLQEVIALYPECDNSRNTAAWFAARAMRKLDTAENHVRKALAVRPNQSAYLDTMAEIQFARGKRDEALKWSHIAVNFTPEDILLRRQHERFRSEPFPR